MKLFQLTYSNGKWSKEFPKEFDSASTLAFVFFKSQMKNDPFWQDLKKLLPTSHIVGCSGAGEIKETSLLDDEVVVSLAKFERTNIQLSSVDLLMNPLLKLKGLYGQQEKKQYK